MTHLIGLACFAWLATTAAPAVAISNYLTGLIKNGLIRALVSKLFGCSLCFGFWLGLVATGSAWDASVCAVLAEGIYRADRYFTVL